MDFIEKRKAILKNVDEKHFMKGLDRILDYVLENEKKSDFLNHNLVTCYNYLIQCFEIFSFYCNSFTQNSSKNYLTFSEFEDEDKSRIIMQYGNTLVKTCSVIEYNLNQCINLDKRLEVSLSIKPKNNGDTHSLKYIIERTPFLDENLKEKLNFVVRLRDSIVHRDGRAKEDSLFDYEGFIITQRKGERINISSVVWCFNIFISDMLIFYFFWLNEYTFSKKLEVL